MTNSVHMLGECDTRNKNLYIRQHKKRPKHENEKKNNEGEGKKNEKKKKKEKICAPCEDRTHDLQISIL